VPDSPGRTPRGGASSARSRRDLLHPAAGHLPSVSGQRAEIPNFEAYAGVARAFDTYQIAMDVSAGLNLEKRT